MSKYKNKIGLAILISLVILNSILVGSKVLNSTISTLDSELISFLTNNKVGLITIVILVQVFITLFVVLVDTLIFLCLSKIILKANQRFKIYYFPIIVGNIVNIIVNILVSFVVSYNSSNITLISLLSPSTLIKVIVIYYLLLSTVFENKKRKAILICIIYLALIYSCGVINYFIM